MINRVKVHWKMNMSMKLYVVNFNTEQFKVEADVVTISYHSFDDQYQKILEVLDAEGIDVLDYDEDIAILVDDIGFTKPNNPIYRIVTGDGISCELAGKLVFVRNIYNENSTDFGSITYEDIFNLRRLLAIKIIGVVR